MKRFPLLIPAFFAILIISCSKDPDTPPIVVPPVTPPVQEDTFKVDPPGSASNPRPEYPGYILEWHDEFDGTSLDLSKWTYETGTGVNGDFGTGQLDRATDRTDNVSIKSGVPNANGNVLNITTIQAFFMDRNYTSGRINTKNKAAFGPGYRIEARVWAKDVRYKGQGFAFWMMPAEKPDTLPHIMWPQGGEIDIMEYVGAIPRYNLGTVHYAWFWENNQWKDWNHGHKGGYYSYNDKEVPDVNPSYGDYPVMKGDLSAGSEAFHVYRIDWYNDRIEFAIDNNIYHIHYFNDGAAFDNGQQDGQDEDRKLLLNTKRVLLSEYSNHFEEWFPFEHKFYMILSAGVGGKDNQTYGGAIVPEAKFPCNTYIDWVRVYKRN